MEKQYDPQEKMPFYEFIDRRGGSWRNYIAFGTADIVRRLSEAQIRLPLWARVTEDRHGNPILACRDYGETVAADATAVEICNWLAGAGAARNAAKGVR